MTLLNTRQKKYLRGLGHNLKPAAYVGQKGLTDNLITEVNTALNAHELIKIRFNDFKERDAKKEIMAILVEQTDAQLVGMIGHMALLFRAHPDEAKREIKLP